MHVHVCSKTWIPIVIAFVSGDAGADPLEKIWFFGVKSWFFTRNTPTMFAPPSVRRNFFKCAPAPEMHVCFRTWRPMDIAFAFLGMHASFKKWIYLDKAVVFGDAREFWNMDICRQSSCFGACRGGSSGGELEKI